MLAAAKKDGTIQTFTQLAREHSVDKATALRGGNLGVLDAKWVSNEAWGAGGSGGRRCRGGGEGRRAGPGPRARGGELRRRLAARDDRGCEPPGVRGQKPDSGHARPQEARRRRGEGPPREASARTRSRRPNETLLASFDVAIDDGTISPRKRIAGGSAWPISQRDRGAVGAPCRPSTLLLAAPPAGASPAGASTAASAASAAARSGEGASSALRPGRAPLRRRAPRRRTSARAADPRVPTTL